MIKRIKSLISVKNLTASQFADLIGVQRSNISHILSGRNKPSLDFIMKITEHFPTVSIDWLLNGKGEMFVTGENKQARVSSQLEIEDLNSNSGLKNEQKPIELQSAIKEMVKEESEQEKPEHPSIPEIPEEQIMKDYIEKSVSIANRNDEIEQVMILYKNGSFKVYTPQK